MLRIIFLLSFYFFNAIAFVHISYANNIDSVGKLQEGVQLNYIFNTYNSFSKADTPGKIRMIIEMGVYSESHPNSEIAVLYSFVKADSLSNTPYEGRITNEYLKAIQLARKNGFKLLEAEALYMIAFDYYLRRGDQERSFEYLTQAYKLLHEYKHKEVDQPAYGKLYIGIGNLYTQFALYDSAFALLQKASGLIKDAPTLLRCYFGLGYNYAKMNNDNNPVPYYQKALSIAEQAKDTAWIGDLCFRIGDEYFKRKAYDQATPYLEISRLYSRDFSSPAPALLELAEINLSYGRKKLAHEQLLLARQILIKGIYTDRTDGKKYRLFNLSELYHLFSSLERSNGNYEKALLYKDSFIVYRDSNQAYDKRRALKDIAFHHKITGQQAELQLLRVKKSRELLLRNSVIIVLILVLVTSLQTLRRIKLQRDKEKELYQVNIQNATRTLHQYVEHLQQKNSIIEQFGHELNDLKQSYEEQGFVVNGVVVEDRQEVMTRLQNTVILTDRDWNEFKILFEKVHPHFFATLKERYPELTQSEVRLLALTKLKLSTREISNMLGISIESVRQSRWRLKKKLRLSEDHGIDILLSEL